MQNLRDGATGSVVCESFVMLGTPGDAEQLLLNAEYLRHEVFTTTVREDDEEQWSWNVTEGYELAIARGEEPIMFEPTDLGITAEHILARYPALDVRHALTESDMAKPVLFVPSYEVMNGQRQATSLLIDGWHRLMRSVTESKETGEPRPLLAYVLTEEEALSIRIAPADEDTDGVPACPGTLLLRELALRVKRQFGSAFPGRQ